MARTGKEYSASRNLKQRRISTKLGRKQKNSNKNEGEGGKEKDEKSEAKMLSSVCKKKKGKRTNSSFSAFCKPLFYFYFFC